MVSPFVTPRSRVYDEMSEKSTDHTLVSSNKGCVGTRVCGRPDSLSLSFSLTLSLSLS